MALKQLKAIDSDGNVQTFQVTDDPVEAADVNELEDKLASQDSYSVITIDPSAGSLGDLVIEDGSGTQKTIQQAALSAGQVLQVEVTALVNKNGSTINFLKTSA